MNKKIFFAGAAIFALSCGDIISGDAGLNLSTDPSAIAGQVADVAQKGIKCEEIKNAKISWDKEQMVGGGAAVAVVAGSGGLLVTAPNFSDDDFKDVVHGVKTDFSISSDEFNRRVVLLNTIGQHLAGFAKRRMPYKFGVLNSNEIGAISTPSGYVFVTKGLLKLPQLKPDHLSLVLAHEVVHNDNMDGMDAMRKLDHTSCVNGAITDTAGSLVTLEAGVAGKNVNLSPAVFGMLKKSADAIANVALKTGYGQDREYEADRRATDLMAQAGYNPKIGKEILTMIPQDKSVFSEHPSPQKRLQRLTAYLAAKTAKPDFVFASKPAKVEFTQAERSTLFFKK